MTDLLSRAAARLSYANVVATLALFIALGGTTYAATSLPRNSVGQAQIRTNSVGVSELRRSAVTSTEIRDRTIRMSDIPTGAGSSLRGAVGAAGPAGPAGVADRAAINAGGVAVGGTSRTGGHTGGNEYTVEFTHDVSGCVYSATLA